MLKLPLATHMKEAAAAAAAVDGGQRHNNKGRRGDVL